MRFPSAGYDVNLVRSAVLEQRIDLSGAANDRNANAALRRGLTK